jgi:hypothetical protein
MSVLEYRSGEDQKADEARERERHWLGWAAYLGMSWTWCIGMFLPVLLVRDYGPWAWVVFAVPNVIGAAAMGWVLREGRSEQLVAHHRFAIEAFSFITATFQIFFALWMFDSAGMEGSGWLVIAVAFLFQAFIRWNQPLALLLAILTFAISLCSLVPVVTARPWDVATYGRGFSRELWGLAPVSIFGFALCPYLDATFHRARQAMPTGAARGAFSMGFGVFFLVMILGTLCYTGLFIDGYGPGQGVTMVYRAIGLHWSMQLALTIALHWQSGTIKSLRAPAAVTVAALAWLGMRFIHDPTMEPGEFVYRLFMSFYGLVFPAYVWICMMPIGREPTTPARAQWIVLAVAVAVASPFYWVAFMQGRMVWVVPGVLIVLAARFAVPKRVVTA